MIDTQIVELRGRLYLQEQLLAAGLEIAMPERDRGVDMVIYAEQGLKHFVAKPIQLKASSGEGFGIYKKYEKIPNLILVFIWNLATPGREANFALTYLEAFEIAKKMGWTKTASWRKGGYSTRAPSRKLRALLNRYEMSAPKWRRKFFR